jgi:type IV fimbrial biogenesis protein FimT
MMKQCGATLLELIVVLAVAAILLTIAVPGFSSLFHASRLTSATNALVASLHVARSEAIKRSQRVVVCPSPAGDACAGSSGWHQGWMVFHDANNNAQRDAGEPVVLAHPPLPSGMRVTSKGSTASYISYTPAGDTQQVGGAWQAGTLTLCHVSASPDSARQVVIYRTGRPRTAKTWVATCG